MNWAESTSSCSLKTGRFFILIIRCLILIVLRWNLTKFVCLCSSSQSQLNQQRDGFDQFLFFYQAHLVDSFLFCLSHEMELVDLPATQLGISSNLYGLDFYVSLHLPTNAAKSAAIVVQSNRFYENPATPC